MKREAMGHTKMKRLCRRLDIPLWQAVGLMETIWHLTARETPRGDIGKLSDEDIALGIDYRGDPKELVSVLVECRWLDESPDCRLKVHDWGAHFMDQSRRGYNTRRRLRWERLQRAGGELCAAIRDFILQRDRTCRHCGTENDLTIDHIIPISRNGTNDIENLQALCRPCNSRKGAR